MAGFEVDVSALTGFALDLSDVGNNFTSNIDRVLPRLGLPEATGRLAELGPAILKLNDTLSDAYARDRGVLESLADNLTTAASRYRSGDEQHATTLNLATNALGGQSAAAGATTGFSRFGALQLPTLPDVQDVACTVRRAVTASIDVLTPYDEHLGQAIGIKPVADHLTPLVADWEHLQGVGLRITALGMNDFVTAQNISSGADWLLTTWTGGAATSFGTAAYELAKAIDQRSGDLDRIGKTIDNVGVFLEHTVRNQATGLLTNITRSLTFLNHTLPLGVWALLGDSDMNGTMRSDVFGAVDSLVRDATARNDAVTAAIDRVSGLLDYRPERAVSTHNADKFALPAKVLADHGAQRYGYGDNIWWQDTMASDARA